MKILQLIPAGWPCKLSECPPGHFVWKQLACFKSDYKISPEYIKISAYNEGGEYLMINEDDFVQPVCPEWIEEDE